MKPMYGMSYNGVDSNRMSTGEVEKFLKFFL